MVNIPMGRCVRCEATGIDSKCYRMTNQIGITCQMGHEFADEGDYVKGIVVKERRKMDKDQQKAVKAASESGQTKSNPDRNPDIVSAKIEKQPTDISIDEINKARLETLLGEFNDSSSLVGRVFAMNEELKELKDVIKTSKKSKVDAEDGVIVASGELKVECFVPENHVQPMIDMAHSYSQSVQRYMNERLIDLFDNMLFY